MIKQVIFESGKLNFELHNHFMHLPFTDTQ